MPVSLGVLLAALSAATLLATIGWRGIAALGALPLVLAIAMSFIVPESVRWLLVRGHADQAQRTLAALLRNQVESIALPPRLPGPPAAGAGSAISIAIKVEVLADRPCCG